MAKTITLADIKILSWRVETDAKRVVVDYLVLQSDGGEYRRNQAVFWAQMPNTTPEAGEDWYQLPAKYVGILTDLTSDIKTALVASKIA